jgi:hydroxymethylpyrimidine/phosphomethylpyrimidine kinase
LAAAIAASLARGASIEESVRVAKSYVTAAIKSSPMLGKGHPAVNHLTDPFRN